MTVPRPARRFVVLALALPLGSVACALVAGLEDKQAYDSTTTDDGATAEGGPNASEGGPNASDGASAAGVEIVASGQAKPWGVAVDDAYVYWTNEGDGTVMRVAKAGGAPVAIARGQAEPHEILVDPSNVVWNNTDLSNDAAANYFDIAHLDKPSIGAGAPPTRITQMKGASKLRDLSIAASLDNDLWTAWVDKITRYHRNDDRQSKDAVKNLTAQQPTAVAVDELYVYWFQQQTVDVWRLAKAFDDASAPEAGTIPTPIAALTGTPELADMVGDGKALYLVTRAGDLVKVTTPNGGPPVPLATGQTFPRAILTDDKYVYITRSGPDDAAGQGAVVMVAKSGAETKTIAQGLDQPRGLAVDVASDGTRTVYWATYGDGKIQRAKVR